MICEEHDKSVCPELLGCPWCLIASQRSTIDFLKGEMENAKSCRHLAELQLQIERSRLEKERKGMCRAVTRANKARNAMGRWTVAIQNENDLLRLMLKDRGINADFMWKAKRALETLEKLRDIVATVGESELGDYPELSAYCRMLEDAITGEPGHAE